MRNYNKLFFDLPCVMPKHSRNVVNVRTDIPIKKLKATGPQTNPKKKKLTKKKKKSNNIVHVSLDSRDIPVSNPRFRSNAFVGQLVAIDNHGVRTPIGGTRYLGSPLNGDNNELKIPGFNAPPTPVQFFAGLANVIRRQNM